jgi:hypothetical protein
MPRLQVAASFLLALSFSPAAQAQNLDSMMRSQELGTILASEKICDLTLNHAGIEAWIAANVAKDDLQFASSLNMITQGLTIQFSEFSAASKTAHCATVRMTAKTMGLID